MQTLLRKEDEAAMNPVTVLLVGAGRFGANYITVLSQIQRQRSDDLPRIGRLILSRTQKAAAQALAAQIAARPDCPFEEIAGIEINKTGQLEAALRSFSPALTCITARDPVLGDDIHALYALPALDSGAVLCEKPFCRADGKGGSLEPARALGAHPHAHRFGLELPMAVVGRAMASDPVFKRLLVEAQTIDFVWQKQKDSADLVSDLALHPWSLLPLEEHTEVVDVRVTPGQSDIQLRLDTREGRSGPIAVTIRLAAGGVFRGMRIDDRGFQLDFEKNQVHIWEYRAPWAEVVQGHAPRHTARRVLAVDNPLRRHLESILAGHPLVDWAHTLRSQQFLEACCPMP